TDKGNAYFADGIQDLILTKLADIGDLKVISRTSTMKYASHPDDLKQIAQQLGVATILEGSVQKAGNQVLINVQLINAQTDSHIWAQSYTRTLTNIFGVEGEVAGKVAAALNAKLTQSESARVTAVPTHDPKAYNEYLRATHYANEARKGGYLTFLPKAIAAYQQAVKQDPQFALAWAGLSKTRSEARYWGVDTSQHNLREAAAAAARALSLAPDLPEAHVAMGAVARFLYHDLEAAHAQYEQAVRLRPNSPGALDKLAINDGNRGQMAASFRTYRRLIALEPEQSSPVMGLGLFQMVAGDYDAARGTLASALAINPNGAESWALLSRIDVLQNGDVNAAVRVLDRMPPGTPRNLHVAIQRIRLLLYRRDFAGAGQLAAKFATQFDSGSGPVTIAIHRANGAWLAGDKPAAHRFYRELIALLASPKYDVNGTDHADLGVAYARLGNADRAVQEIETGVKIMRHAHYANISYFDVAMAKVQLAFGHKTQAINALRKALTQQNHGLWLSPALLQLDPTWDPIRHDPRFQALLKKYGQSAPATATSVLPVPATSEANHG
ncbi:MAG: tetratricopeptide repeat protein, partial [Rhodanobacteraceae bacterium]